MIHLESHNNKVFKKGDFIVKKYGDGKEQSINNEHLILERLGTRVVREGSSFIFPYLDHDSWNDDFISDKMILMLGERLNSFHTIINIEGIASIDYREWFEKSKHYLQSVDWIAESLVELSEFVDQSLEMKYSNNISLTHQDLSSGNILISKNAGLIEIIDFEFSDICNNIFDVVSFIYDGRRKLNRKQVDLFISALDQSYDTVEVRKAGLGHIIFTVMASIEGYNKTKNPELMNIAKKHYEVFKKLEKAKGIYIDE